MASKGPIPVSSSQNTKTSSYSNGIGAHATSPTSFTTLVPGLDLGFDSLAVFRLGDRVLAQGRPAVVVWDGRPTHGFCKVKYDDGSLSDVIPFDEVQANGAARPETRVERRMSAPASYIASRPSITVPSSGAITDRGGDFFMAGTMGADAETLLQACREANMELHGNDDYDAWLTVPNRVYSAYLRSASQADSKIFGQLSKKTTNLTWAIDTYFPGETFFLGPENVILFWDHILTFGSHSFLVITRTHVAHRTDYSNFKTRWLVRLEDIVALEPEDFIRDGNRRRLKLMDGTDVILAAALGPYLHELVAALARMVRQRAGSPVRLL